MKAFRIEAYEGTPALEETTVRTPGAGEVLVRVEAAALNPLDVKLQRGFMHAFFPLAFPYTLGTDLAGVVEAVGPGVTAWRAGDRVVARTDPTAGGALAECAVVFATHLARRPDDLGAVEAAALPTAAGTAWQALFEVGHLREGQTVLIHAGAGGVGSFAVQYARAAGARVIATASGDGVEIVRRLGADRVIDHRAEDFASGLSDLDLVLDTVGGDTQQRSYALLRAGGVLAATSAPPDEALAKAHRVTATFVFHTSDAERLGRIVEDAAAGRSRALVDRTVPLAEAVAGFERQASGRARGKIVVTV